MRIKFIIPSKDNSDYINYELYHILRQELNSLGEVDIVDDSPDIVHVFGTWSNKCFKTMYKYRKIGVPVVFTSLMGMIPLVNKNGMPITNSNTHIAIKKMAKKNIIVHVCGSKETLLIKQVTSKANVVQILNPSFTSLMTARQMSKCFFELYTSEIKRNEKEIIEVISRQLVSLNIEDPIIFDICLRLIYIKKRFIMHNIPIEYLRETSKKLYVSNYDERLLRNIIITLKMSKTASAIMSLLKDVTNLTEGFMPIEYTDGKYVEQMKKYIL